MDHIGHISQRNYFHINWHCYEDFPKITPEIEKVLYEFIIGYCNKTKGVHFKSVGGTETHIHLAFQMEPYVLLSGFIGKIKGAASHHINNKFGKNSLKWQRGYGTATYAEKDLPAVINYILNQKIHHQKGTTKAALEEYGDNIEE